MRTVGVKFAGGKADELWSNEAVVGIADKMMQAFRARCCLRNCSRTTGVTGAAGGGGTSGLRADDLFTPLCMDSVHTPDELWYLWLTRRRLPGERGASGGTPRAFLIKPEWHPSSVNTRVLSIPLMNCGLGAGISPRSSMEDETVFECCIQYCPVQRLYNLHLYDCIVWGRTCVLNTMGVHERSALCHEAAPHLRSPPLWRSTTAAVYLGLESELGALEPCIVTAPSVVGAGRGRPRLYRYHLAASYEDQCRMRQRMASAEEPGHGTTGTPSQSVAPADG